MNPQKLKAATQIAQLASDSFSGIDAPGAKLMRFCEEELKLSPRQSCDLMLLTVGFISATEGEHGVLGYKPSAYEVVMLMTGAMVVDTVRDMAEAIEKDDKGGENANA